MTDIEWTDRTWNPVRGCSRVSPGCERCYAERQAHRFSAKGQPYEGLTVLGKHGPRWVGRARFVPEMLGVPLRWRMPQRVFVNSMSDLFHEDVAYEEIAAVFGVMAACPQHTFQVLTKRPARMKTWFALIANEAKGWASNPPASGAAEFCAHRAWLNGDVLIGNPVSQPWPLPNVWLGVSCEDQQRADERIPLLLQTPSAVRFVSAEPLLGSIDLTHLDADAAGHREYCQVDALTGRHRDMGRPCRDTPKLDWVIAGGESGPGARPCATEWIEQIVDECAAAGVPCFVKQLGAWPLVPHDEPPDRWPVTVRWQDGDYVAAGAPLRLRTEDRKGGDPAEWPKALRVREFPERPL